MRYTRPAQPLPNQPEPFDPTPPNQRWRYGWLFRPASFWIGAHWSPHNKRLCVNVVPCVTLWVVMPGGFAP